jgi:hypothetical protein
MSPHSSPRDLDDRGRRRTTRAPHAPRAPRAPRARRVERSVERGRDARRESEF